MNPVLEAAAELQRFLESLRWRFCVIGGLAVLRWGQPRTTQDVDVSLERKRGKEKGKKKGKKKGSGLFPRATSWSGR